MALRERVVPSSNTIIISLLCFIIGVTVFAIVQDISRQAQYKPICAKYGWVLAQSGPLNMPRCLDIDSGLFHVPPEIYYPYVGEPIPPKPGGK